MNIYYYVVNAGANIELIIKIHIVAVDKIIIRLRRHVSYKHTHTHTNVRVCETIIVIATVTGDFRIKMDPRRASF